MVIMSSTKIDGNEIKHRLGQKGMNLVSFAEKYHFQYRMVSDVVRGINRGNYGKGRDVLDKIHEVLASDEGD